MALVSERIDRWGRILVPGLAFQAVVIGGGYATGRELVEFFMSSGPLGGLLAMIVTALLWSVTMGISLEFARRFRAYEYRTFFQELLGSGWVVFECAYLLLVILVLSIVAASAGAIVEEGFGLPRLLGTVGMTAGSMVLLFWGSKAVGRLLAWWSIVLYISFITLFTLCFSQFGDRIYANLASAGIGEGQFLNGLTYAGVNINCLVAVLFLVPKLETRSEAVTAGLLVGPVAMFPGALFYAAMLPFYPAIQGATVPLNVILEGLNLPAFMVLVQSIILVTLMKTAVGLLHSINERVAAWQSARDRPFPRWHRAALALVLMLFSVTVAEKVGLVALIDKGYGFLSWVFVILIFAPVFTIALWKLRRGQVIPSEAVPANA